MAWQRFEFFNVAAKDTEEAVEIVRKALQKVQGGCKVRLIDPSSITRELFRGTQGCIRGCGGYVGRGYVYPGTTTTMEVYYWKVDGAVHLVVDVGRTWVETRDDKSGWIKAEKTLVIDRFLPKLEETAKRFSERFLKLKKIKAPKEALLCEYDPKFNTALVSVAGKMYFCTEYGHFATTRKSLREVYKEIRSKIGKGRLSPKAKDPKKELRQAMNKYIMAQLAQ